MRWVCFALLLSAGFAHADEDLRCNPNATDSATLTQAVASQSAGFITDGQPIKLSGAAYDRGDSCSKSSCDIKTGITGVMLRQVGSKVCVGLPGTGKLNTFFALIPASRWHGTDSRSQPLKRWTGVWQNESGKITIQPADATRLHIVGAGIWVNGDNVHMGRFDVTEAPQDGVVLSQEEKSDCQIALRVVGDYLVAADNGGCGGVNVRFNGMYRFRHR